MEQRTIPRLGRRVGVIGLAPLDGDRTTAQFALRRVVDQPGVTMVIPGARDAAQARGDAAVAGQPPLSGGDLAAVHGELVRPRVNDRW